MPETHARLSASGSKKWLNCPGCIQLEAQFPDVTSQYAAEGTTAHALGEAKINLAMKKISRIGYHKQVEKLDIAEDMQDYTDGYRDFVLERYNSALQHSKDAVLAVERRIDLSSYIPDGFGTGDAVIISTGALEIIDLKYGQGVPVSAKSNPQLRLYALGALDYYDYLYGIDTVTMTIYQPRIDNISSETMTTSELYKWGEKVKEKAKIANDDNVLDCIAGKHCDDGFCKARPICRAYAEQKQKLAVYDFRPPEKLSTDEIAEIIDQADSLCKWAKLVKDYALGKALNDGIRFPGFKLVEGRSNRTYTGNEKEIVARLTENGYTEKQIFSKKLKGITDMEKLLGKADFQRIIGNYVIKSQGAPTLVPMEDKRPEINSVQQAREDFKEIIEN